MAEETATTVGPGEAGKAGKAKRGFLWRFARAVVVGNLGLVAVIACGAIAAHTYATSSEERFQGVVAFATQYVLVPASLVEDHGFNRETGERVARLVEGLVIDGAGRGPRTDAHLYFQARVLLAMPAVYKTFGRTQERVERAERSIAMFADLVARNPANTDYRRRFAVSQNLFGEDLADMGRHDQAIEQRRMAIAIAEGLLADQPGHWRWRWYIATAELGIASSLTASGRRDHAAPHAEIARVMARELCQERPNDDLRMCDLAARAEQASLAHRPTP